MSKKRKRDESTEPIDVDAHALSQWLTDQDQKVEQNIQAVQKRETEIHQSLVSAVDDLVKKLFAKREMLISTLQWQTNLQVDALKQQRDEFKRWKEQLRVSSEFSLDSDAKNEQPKKTQCCSTFSEATSSVWYYPDITNGHGLHSNGAWKGYFEECLKSMEIGAPQARKASFHTYTSAAIPETWSGHLSSIWSSSSQMLSVVRIAANCNHGWAHSLLGRLHEYGRFGVEQNDQEAVRRFLLAAAQKEPTHTPAAISRTMKLFVSPSVPMDEKAQLAYELGCCYRYGYGVDSSVKRAISYWQKASDRGHAVAQHRLGQCYDGGMGIAQDISRAFELYKLAAHSGFAQAQNDLAVCYSEGAGTIVDNAEANRWYEAAANQGEKNAQYNLGIRLLHGQRCKVDLVKGVAMLNRAANQGDIQALTKLAECYITGKGVARNPELAFEINLRVGRT